MIVLSGEERAELERRVACYTLPHKVVQRARSSSSIAATARSPIWPCLRGHPRGYVSQPTLADVAKTHSVAPLPEGPIYIANSSPLVSKVSVLLV